jgi:hypothetical protein
MACSVQGRPKKGDTGEEQKSRACSSFAYTFDGFQDAFKIWQKLWERCISAEGNYFEGDGGQ